MCLLIWGLTTNNLIFLICGCITLIAAILNNWYVLFPEKAQEKHIDAVNKIHLLLNNAVAETSATGIMLFTTHNGGGLPDSHKNFKVTALQSSTIYIDTSDKYINLKVDIFYAQMLQNIIKNNHYGIRVSDMEPCKLKNILVSEDIKKFLAYKIKFTSIGLVYISFSSKSDIPWGQKDKAYFEHLIDKLNPNIYVTATLYSKFINIIKFRKTKQ